jgi:hypothetical protein
MDGNPTNHPSGILWGKCKKATEGNPCGALGNTLMLEAVGAQWGVRSDSER